MDGEEVLRFIPCDMVNDGVGGDAALLQRGRFIGDNGQCVADGAAHDARIADAAVFGAGGRNGFVDLLDGVGDLLFGLPVFIHSVHTGKERFTQPNKTAAHGKPLGLEGGHPIPVFLGETYHVIIEGASGISVCLQTGENGRLEYIASDVL